MPHLAAGLLATAFPKAAGPGYRRRRRAPIGGRWLAAVAAVPGQLGFQFLDPSLKSAVPGLQFLHPCHLAHQKENEPLGLGVTTPKNLRNALRSVVGFTLFHTDQNTFYREFMLKRPAG